MIVDDDDSDALTPQIMAMGTAALSAALPGSWIALSRPQAPGTVRMLFMIVASIEPLGELLHWELRDVTDAFLREHDSEAETVLQGRDLAVAAQQTTGQVPLLLYATMLDGTRKGALVAIGLKDLARG